MSNVYSAALEAKAALYDKLMKKENLPGTYGVLLVRIVPAC